MKSDPFSSLIAKALSYLIAHVLLWRDPPCSHKLIIAACDINLTSELEMSLLCVKTLEPWAYLQRIKSWSTVCEHTVHQSHTFITERIRNKYTYRHIFHQWHLRRFFSELLRRQEILLRCNTITFFTYLHLEKHETVPLMLRMTEQTETLRSERSLTLWLLLILSRKEIIQRLLGGRCVFVILKWDTNTLQKLMICRSMIIFSIFLSVYNIQSVLIRSDSRHLSYY